MSTRMSTRGEHLLSTFKNKRSKVLTSNDSVLVHYIDRLRNRGLDEYYTTAIRKTCVKVIGVV